MSEQIFTNIEDFKKHFFPRRFVKEQFEKGVVNLSIEIGE